MSTADMRKLLTSSLAEDQRKRLKERPGAVWAAMRLLLHEVESSAATSYGDVDALTADDRTGWARAVRAARSAEAYVLRGSGKRGASRR